MEHIYSSLTTSISELKKSPTAILNAASGRPIALLNNNKATAYIVPAKLYEKMIEELEDLELSKIANERMKDSGYVKVDINDL
jgi:antitoxin StbD